MIRILADKHSYKLDQFLSNEIELVEYDPTEPLPDLNGFDALFVRTVSKINKSTIPVLPSSLKIIGTGSSGSDHIDRDHFRQNGVIILDAIGSNANAVSEYVMTGLLLWSIKRGKDLTKFKVGIVGAGATGSAVARQCAAFGIDTVSYDPPKEQREAEFKSSTLEDVLSCDILTFHVPLTHGGSDATFHWLDEEKLANRKYELVINAARGGVIDELALLKMMDEKSVKDVIIDVWESEPDFNTALVEKAFIATPHIAGYSEQAKLNASKMLVEQMSEFFEISILDYSHLYEPKTLDIADLNYSLYELLLRLHPLREYDADIRDLCLRPDKSVLFRKLRNDRPLRFEYPYLNISDILLQEFEALVKLRVKANN